MKADIHPTTHRISAKCACGASFSIESTIDSDITLDVCSQCHPFYTGKSNLIDTAGRVDKFKERFAKTNQMRDAAKNRSTAKKEKPAKKEDSTENDQ